MKATQALRAVLLGSLAILLSLVQPIARAESRCSEVFTQVSIHRRPSRELGLIDFATNLKAADGTLYHAEHGMTTRSGGQRVWNRLNELGPDFTQLIVDPGIALHIDKFIKFAQAFEYRTKDPWSVRDAFSKHLGTVEVYRALALTEVEFNQIWNKGDGMVSTQALQGMSAKNATENFLIWKGMNNTINHRTQGIGQPSVLLSVTKYPDVAVYVANAFAQISQNKQVYLFKIRVPKLDLIYQEIGSDIFPYNPEIEIVPGAKPGQIADFKGVDQIVRSHRVDRDLESFVFLKIERSEIVSYERLPDFR